MQLLVNGGVTAKALVESLGLLHSRCHIDFNNFLVTTSKRRSIFLCLCHTRFEAQQLSDQILLSIIINVLDFINKKWQCYFNRLVKRKRFLNPSHGHLFDVYQRIIFFASTYLNYFNFFRGRPKRCPIFMHYKCLNVYYI